MAIPRRRWILYIACFVLCALAYISYHTSRVWSCGSFLEGRFSIRIVDEKGRPIEGVNMWVSHITGGLAYGYPVTDFVPGLMPTSDRNGMLLFHHFHGKGPEFCGSTRSLFWYIPIDDDDPPDYKLRFSRKGYVSHETTFRSFRSRCAQTNEVEATFPFEPWRAWKTMRTDKDGEWYGMIRDDFDADRNGRLSRSEWVSFQNTVDVFDDLRQNDAAKILSQPVKMWNSETTVNLLSDDL